MIQKIGMFVLVTFALIALIKQPDTVGDFVQGIGTTLAVAFEALGDLFSTVS